MPHRKLRKSEHPDPVTCINNNGEVVVPAGGETGGPHCLAEVHRLRAAAFFQQLKEHILTTPALPKKI